MSPTPTIIITGSSGLVGSRLVTHFSNLGFKVRAFQRNIPKNGSSSVAYFSFDLADIRDNGFAGADYLVHCAYRPIVSRRDRKSKANIDVEGTKRIIDLCRKHGIKPIFLSSLSANPRARSYYGKHKLLTEGLFNTDQDLVLKLGLVIGSGGGVIGRIADVLKRPIIPLIGGGNQRVQIIAVDDVCRIIEAGIKNNISGSFKIAHPTVILMKDLYRAIAEKAGARPWFVPVPTPVVYWLLRSVEQIGLQLPFTSENVLNLKQFEVFDTVSDLAVFGLEIKDPQTILSQLNLSDGH